ncbi:hypothetical protein [Streptosporangium sp. NPDC087985]|uniref:hypothetical protein n=1 Tax=Streptosporangium sp. NPDC087985 TaxID=3366196 RepID=UPI00381F7CA5
MIAVTVALLLALAAALLGVAAARRGWWLHAAITGVCTLLAVYVALLLAAIPAATIPVWTAGVAALLVVDALVLTAWSLHRDREKTGGRR